MNVRVLGRDANRLFVRLDRLPVLPQSGSAISDLARGGGQLGPAPLEVGGDRLARGPQESLPLVGGQRAGGRDVGGAHDAAVKAADR